MLKSFSINLAIVFLLFLLFSGCNNDNTNSSGVDVSGTWRAQMAVETCTPADLCSATGLNVGTMVNAVMTLSQNESKVQGTYTYQGAGISSDVSGTVVGNQIVLDGAVTQLLGRITVHLIGTVLNNQMQTTVSHDVTLTDGRSGRITGSGNFSRS
jgi:hypothetical protein